MPLGLSVQIRGDVVFRFMICNLAKVAVQLDLYLSLVDSELLSALVYIHFK